MTSGDSVEGDQQPAEIRGAARRRPERVGARHRERERDEDDTAGERRLAPVGGRADGGSEQTERE